MKKFVLTFLLSAFVFVSVHDYIVVHIDHDTQSELYLYESGQITEVCDTTEKHQALHDSLMAINIVFFDIEKKENPHCSPLGSTNFFLNLSSTSIYHPPIA